MKKNAIEINVAEKAEGRWILGAVVWNGMKYGFQIKQSETPSENAIKGGRIVKLILRREGTPSPRLNFERGWEKGRSPYCKGEIVAPLYKAIVAKFN